MRKIKKNANYERLNNLEYDYRDVAVGGFDREAIDNRFNSVRTVSEGDE